MKRALFILSAIACLGFACEKNPGPWMVQNGAGKVGSFSIQKLDSAFYFHWIVKEQFNSSKFIIQKIFPESQDTIEISSDYGVTKSNGLVEYFYVDFEKEEEDPIVRLKIVPDNDQEFFTEAISFDY